MSLFKITTLLLCCIFASCQREESGKIVTQSIAFGIRPNQAALKDTGRYMICGTMMGERLNLNFDPTFSVFWEAFSRDLAKRNFALLIKKTRFPLPYSIDEGQDTLVIYEKKSFQQVFSKFISAEIHGQTRFNRIKDLSSASYAPSSQESVIIEGLIFEKVNGSWCLSALSD